MWYWVFRTIFIVILKLFFRFKLEGLENLPQKTNFIVVANHDSYLDTLAIGAAIPKKVYWIALRDLYNIPILRWFFKMIDALPSGSASDRALSLLVQNKNVGLFPEGGISRTGELREFRRGVAVLAMKTGRPIVPCAILGTFQALPFGKWFPKFVPIKVKIGPPKYLLKEFDEIIDDIYLQEGMLKIKNAIKEMLYAE
jgi:1-acyl-sn-glycerol-3-phosphate acyltransferase